jgi:hypothetical protein
MNRTRLQIWDKAEATKTGTIAIAHVLPFHATLLQFSSNVDGTPDPVDVLSVIKTSGTDPLLDVLIRLITPSDDGQYIICNEHFQFLKGDTLTVTYPNTADDDVGFEAIFKEGD